MKKPIHVLQISDGTQGLLGGVATLTIRWNQYIDKSKIKFTFLSRSGTYENIRDKIEGGGSKIIDLHATGKGMLAYIKYTYKLFKHIKNNCYDIVHISSGSSGFNSISLFASKMAGAKIRIVHSRNAPATLDEVTIRVKLMCMLAQSLATHYFSISKKAAIWMFSKRLIASGKVQILKNGLSTEEFVYDEAKRKQLRSDFELGDNFVIGHIGRFVKQKNHIFLLEIFHEVLLLHPNSMLLLIGEGGLEENIRKRAQRLGILDKIKFIGFRKDIPAVLSAMDVFVFPSLHEGFGNVGLEAQATGLPAVMSDTIPEEILVTDKAVFLSLDQSAKEWAKTILNYTNYKRKDEREKIIEAGYDIKDVVKTLENNYITFYNNVNFKENLS